ncbi:MAG TPA: YbhB/YbcL family Raf kinase inhibitor-like protein [Galbitalea sp.]
MHPVEVLFIPLGKALRKRRGDEALSISHAPELATDTHLTLSSPGFRDGEEIPARFCGPLIGPDISPAFTWNSLPTGTVDLVLMMEDLDVPARAPGIHMIAEFAPVQDGLPEGALVAGASEITYVPWHGRPGRYGGPRPIPGHGPHRYRFHLYALNTHVDLTRLTGPEQLPAALAGHVLASGILVGTRTS